MLAAFPSVAEFHAQLRAWPNFEAIRHTLNVTQIDDPEDDMREPSGLIEIIDVEPPA